MEVHPPIKCSATTSPAQRSHLMVSNFLSTCRALLTTPYGLCSVCLSRHTTLLRLSNGSEQFFIPKRLLQQGQNRWSAGDRDISADDGAVPVVPADPSKRSAATRRKAEAPEPDQFFFCRGRINIQNHGAHRIEALNFALLTFSRRSPHTRCAVALLLRQHPTRHRPRPEEFVHSRCVSPDVRRSCRGG